MAKSTFLDLLEDSLPPKAHPRYKVWKDYELKAVERGQKIVKEVKQYVDVHGKSVLDLGCGTGGISVAFAKEGANVVGLDSGSTNPRHIKIARARAKDENRDLIIIYGDVQRLPFRNRIFDIVVCSDVIEHVLKPEEVAKEVSRVLKSDGILYLSAPNKFSLPEIYKDGHYGLFGVVLLPRPLAEIYVTKIRKMEKKYSVGYIPTYPYLMKIFKKNGIQLDLISNDRIDEIFNNPMKIENGNYRKIGIVLKKLCLTKIVVRLFSLPFFAAIFIFIGHPNKQLKISKSCQKG